MPKSAVVITGVGAATPLGSDYQAFAANLLAGKSAARQIVDTQAGVDVRLPACLADDPPVPAGWPLCRLSRFAPQRAVRLVVLPVGARRCWLRQTIKAT